MTADERVIMEAICDFCEREFDEKYTPEELLGLYDNSLNRVGIAFTSGEDDTFDIQSVINVKDKAILTYKITEDKDDELVSRTRFKDYESMKRYIDYAVFEDFALVDPEDWVIE